MLTADPNDIAMKMMARLSAYFGRDGMEEVVVNTPGRIWTKMRRGEWEEHVDAALSYEYLLRVCKVLANINSARFDETDVPVVSCEVPGLPFRFQGILGQNVRYELGDRRGVGIAVRSLIADKSITFGSYGLGEGVVAEIAATAFDSFAADDAALAGICNAIARKESILVSGATSTGKTTFVNRLIERIPLAARIITIEDARELSVPHANRLHLMAPRNRGSNALNYNMLLESIVRLTPDWIVCGEISIGNAAGVYATMGKGHPIVSTIHANSPREAIRAIVNNMSLSGTSGSNDAAMEENIARNIGAIIQIERVGSERRVVAVAYPSRGLGIS